MVDRLHVSESSAGTQRGEDERALPAYGPRTGVNAINIRHVLSSFDADDNRYRPHVDMIN